MRRRRRKAQGHLDSWSSTAENGAKILAPLIAVYTMIRIIVLGRGHPAIVLEIIRRQGFSGLGSAMIGSILHLFALVIGLAVVFLAYERKSSRGAIVGGLITLGALLITPISLVFIVLLLVLMLVLVAFDFVPSGSSKASTDDLYWIAPGVAATALTLIAVIGMVLGGLTTSWLPREQIGWRASAGGRAVNGYVLGESGGFLSVLVDTSYEENNGVMINSKDLPPPVEPPPPRSPVIYIASDAVRWRRICSDNRRIWKFDAKSVMSLLSYKLDKCSTPKPIDHGGELQDTDPGSTTVQVDQISALTNQLSVIIAQQAGTRITPATEQLWVQYSLDGDLQTRFPSTQLVTVEPVAGHRGLNLITFHGRNLSACAVDGQSISGGAPNTQISAAVVISSQAMTTPVSFSPTRGELLVEVVTQDLDWVHGVLVTATCPL